MILRGNVFSRTLEMETGITIIAPGDYQRNHPLQVIYLLHGLCGRSGDWAEYTMLPVYANQYHTLFVLPDGARSFYTNMKYGFRYFSYITEELPQICNHVFQISANREDTAIMGASMGGYGALKCALSKPEQYGWCCAFSSPCLFLKEDLEDFKTKGHTKEFIAMFGEQLIRDFQGIFGEEYPWSPEDEILELAKKVSSQAVKPNIYTSCGTEDPFTAYNRRFRDEMSPIDIEYSYEEWPGGHDWNFFNEALQKGLTRCFTQ